MTSKDVGWVVNLVLATLAEPLSSNWLLLTSTRLHFPNNVYISMMKIMTF